MACLWHQSAAQESQRARREGCCYQGDFPGPQLAVECLCYLTEGSRLWHLPV